MVNKVSFVGFSGGLIAPPLDQPLDRDGCDLWPYRGTIQ